MRAVRTNRGLTLSLLVLCGSAWSTPGHAQEPDDPVAAIERFIEQGRARLEQSIRDNARETAGLTGRDTLSEKTIAAVMAVPRHQFVPPELLPFAYHDRPLPLTATRSVSQPFIVALMVDLLALAPDDRVLEIGTGTGYVSAVLAELSTQIFTVEVDAELFPLAGQRLTALGYGDRVRTREANGLNGWDAEAPFDAIIVRGAVVGLPGPLLAQLKPGGRMVLPFENAEGEQMLVRVTKDAQGEISVQPVLPVRFAPLPVESNTDGPGYS